MPAQRTMADVLVDGLDHVAVVSAHAEALFDAYRRMGFSLTAWSRHSGAPAPGEPSVPWGTGNRCAMFRNGYLELLAIADTSLHCGPFPALVKTYEGLHIVAFAVRQAEETARRLADAGVAVAGVVPLQRALLADGAEQIARFSLVRLKDGEAPEARLNFIQHHTPALLWQEPFLDHPNGALALSEVMVCVPDLDASLSRYRRLTGIVPQRAGRRHVFHFRAGAFSLVAADDLAAELPGAAAPTLPFVAAFTVDVRDLAAASALLENNSVDAAHEEKQLIVPFRQGSGAACIMKQAA